MSTDGYLLAVCLVACVTHITPVMSQCTTKHCFDDETDLNAVTATVDSMAAMVAQLTTTVGRLTTTVAQLEDVVERQHQDYQDELTKLKRSFKRRLPTQDCSELLEDGHTVNGVYNIYLSKARKHIQVYCDMETDGGGWLVFQRRQDGSVDFFRDWADYKEGFGDVAGEFWLGNDYLHDITSQRRYTLRIDLEDFDNATRYVYYSSCMVAAESDKYRLTLGKYINGTTGDGLHVHHNNSYFSTKDRDNDAATASCAQSYKGGWWYGYCHSANLNGLYLHGPHSSYADGIEWSNWRGQRYSLKKVEMKLRPWQNPV